MDRSLGTVAQPRIQDVTNQILKSHALYGGSDNTAQHRTASGKSLNYANGASIQKPVVQICNIVPFSHNYQDAVGLFGAENHFVKFHLDIMQEQVAKPFMEPGWEPSGKFYKTRRESEWEQYSTSMSFLQDDNYEPAKVEPYGLPQLNDLYLSVRLINLGTDNIYVDDWLDVRLYGKNREEHSYDLMYVKQNDFFYVGFHARNTKRLPYNVQVRIGESATSYDNIEDKRYIMRRN